MNTTLMRRVWRVAARPMTYATLGALLLGAVGAAAIGCEGTTGEQGNLVFSDRTRDPVDFLNLSRALNRPVAEGASIVIGVRTSDGQDAAITSATSVDTDILIVESFQNDELVVMGLSAGTAALDVSAAGLSDRITVAVEPIASTTLEVLPWGESQLLPDVLYSDGVALAPEGRTSVFVTNRDGAGERLSGYDAVQLSVDSEDANLTQSAGSDFYSLVAPTELGTITLTSDDSIDTADETDVPSIDQTFEVVSMDDIVAISLHHVMPDAPEVEAEFTIAASAELYVLAAYLEDGRYVISTLDDTFEFVVAEGSESLVSLRAQDDFSEGLAAGRALLVDYLAEGVAVFTIRWQGFELDYEVIVTQPAEPQNTEDDNSDDTEGDIAT